MTNNTRFKELVAAAKRVPWVEASNSAIKARLQEAKASRGLLEYRLQAQRAGIAPLEGAALTSALRRRLAARQQGRVPKQLGNLHIFVLYPHESWVTVLPRSLQPFGRVTAYDYLGRGFVPTGAPTWLKERERFEQDVLEAFRRADEVQPVDAVVAYVSGILIGPETLRQMGKRGAAIFNFCWDDKLDFPGTMVGGRYRTPAAIASAVDLNLTNAPDSVLKYAVHGGLAMFWPEAAHPEVHQPCHVPFEFDVSFVGSRYGWRPRFIERLRRAGIAVECFGHGWPRGPLSDEGMVELYSRSRINLGFAGVGHSKRLMCLKGRDFEVPMSGGLYLTQNNPELSRVFEVGKEIVTFSDEQDCIQQIRQLLRDPVRSAQIRRAGRERALRDHTYCARWTQVFEMAGLLPNQEWDNTFADPVAGV